MTDSHRGLREAVEAGRRAGRQSVPPFLWALLAVGLLLKGWLILSSVPAMTVILDEIFYFSNAYDLLHLGQPGVPHPQFLFYPPLTSLLTAPLHLPNLPDPLPYQLSLLLLSAFLASVVVAARLLFKELFGFGSRFVVFAVALSCPAYLGLSLMSEPVFITSYVWGLYFYVRFLKSGSLGHALGAALLFTAMIWTRPNGLGLLPALLVAAVVDLWLHRRRATRRRVRGAVGHLVLFLLPLLGHLGLEVLLDRFADPANWNFGTREYLGRALARISEAPAEALYFLRKVAANSAYVVLGTYGLAATSVLVFLSGRHGLGASLPVSAARRRIVQIFVVQVGIFMIFAAFAAALHMYVYGFHVESAKYEMYGRYMEYFLVPLLVVAIGFLELARRAGTAWRGSALLLVALAVTCSVAVVPWPAMEQLLAPRFVRVNPNHPGIGWVLEIFRIAGREWLLPLCVVSTSALAAGWLFSVGGRWRERLRLVAQGTLLILMSLNAAMSIQQTVERSRGVDARRRGPCSTYIAEHPDIFSRGLFLELTMLDSQPGRPQMLAIYVDHLDLAIMGGRVRDYLGRIPVVSQANHRGYEILCRDHRVARNHGGLKIFGAQTKRPDKSFPGWHNGELLFGDGFEGGDVSAWSGAVSLIGGESRANDAAPSE